VKKEIRLEETEQLKRKNILVKSDKLNKDKENKRKIVEKIRIKIQKVNKERSE
jgi:hypothetical protein